MRAVELVFACDEALSIVEAYEPPDPPWAPVPGIAGVGYGASEAPRGLLFHRYELEADGLIRTGADRPADLPEPARIEADLRRSLRRAFASSDEELAWLCEQTVRNFDPCISCAAHFLDVSVERR